MRLQKQKSTLEKKSEEEAGLVGLSDKNCIICGVEYAPDDLYYVMRVAGEDINMCEFCKDYANKNKVEAGYAMQEHLKDRLKSRGMAYYLRYRDKIRSLTAKFTGKKSLEKYQ